MGRTLRFARWAAVAAGLAGIGYGVAGALGAYRLTNPGYAVRWLLAGIVLHDVVLAPLVAVAGLLVTRLVPGPYRAIVQGALIVSGALALATLPLWRGYTSNPGNPTVDPLPYGRNLAIVLGCVWFAAGALAAGRAWRSRRSPAPAGGREAVSAARPQRGEVTTPTGPDLLHRKPGPGGRLRDSVDSQLPPEEPATDRAVRTRQSDADRPVRRLAGPVDLDEDTAGP